MDFLRAVFSPNDFMPHGYCYFVSAHDEQKTRAQALQAGAIAFLGKPVNDKALLDGINLALK